VQEIAIRVRLQEQDRLGLAEYERVVGSVATVAALAAWLPNPDARLVLRGRGAEPVRLETVTYGTAFEMLVVLDHTSAAVERAAGVLAALIGSVRAEHVEDDVAGVAGEIDRLDRSAPRGRSVAERALRAFLEGARADVLARRSTARVRAAAALVRLAEDGAEITVERVADALVPEIEEIVVEAVEPELGVIIAETPEIAPETAPEDTPQPAQKLGKSKKGGGKKSGGKSSGDGKSKKSKKDERSSKDTAKPADKPKKKDSGKSDKKKSGKKSK
jgi:hypothetical protein